MKRTLRNHRLLLLALSLVLIAVILIWTADKQADRKALENTPPYRYQTFLIEHIKQYLAGQADRADVWHKDTDFYLYRHDSLKMFSQAIQNSTPLDYATYYKSEPPNEATSEELRFVLPELEESFLYSRARLFCEDQQIVFQLTETDGKQLFAIITELRGR